jgi:hypothetical protein
MAICDECYPKDKLQQGWEEGYAEMNKKHKWHKEIKAWADGAEIEYRAKDAIMGWGEWKLNEDGRFLTDSWWEYRIKQQPKKRISAKELIKQVVDEYNASCDKEPQYINVYGWLENGNITFKQYGPYLGKIKLEVDDADPA